MSELPADIAAAIDALEQWHDDALRGYGGGNYGEIRAALDAAILARLTVAAEDNAEATCRHVRELGPADEVAYWQDRALAAEAARDAALARAERLEQALRQARALIWEQLEAPGLIETIDAALADNAAE